MTVEETIIEVSRKHSPTGERYLVKPYPKDNEPRRLRISADLATRSSSVSFMPVGATPKGSLAERAAA